VVYAGLLALVMAIGIYAASMALHPLHVLLSDVDLTVYRDAGLAARQGRPVHGWVICAVTGLIISPVSWDHHWVWIAPALAVLTDTQPRLRAAWWAAGGLAAIISGAWPSLWPGGGAAVPWA
jgi:hypothetical protein